MKYIILALLFLSSFFLANAKIPAPIKDPNESEPDIEEKASVEIRDFTKEELEFIEQLHKDIPELPKDLFKLQETVFRKKLTEEEKAEKKKKMEDKKKFEERLVERLTQDAIEKHSRRIRNMTSEEVDQLHQQLAKELHDSEQKLRKGEL